MPFATQKSTLLLVYFEQDSLALKTKQLSDGFLILCSCLFHAAKETVAASVAGNEEDMQDVKKDTEQAKEVQATEEKADVEKVNGQQLEASVSVENKIVNNTEGEKGASAAADEPVLMDVDVLSSAINGDVVQADKNLVNKGAVKTVESEIHVSPTVATTVATGEDPTSKHEEKQHAVLASEVRLESDVGTFTIQNGQKAEVDGEGESCIPSFSMMLAN